MDVDRKTARNALGLTHYTLCTALAIVSLTNTSFNLAVDWLKDPHRRGVPLSPDLPRDVVKRFLEEIVLASTGEEIVAWGSLENAPCRQALRAAHRIVAKYNMIQRVCLSNYQHGVAPSSRSLLREYNVANRRLSAQGVDLPSIGLVRRHHDSSPRTFMWRWRRKQGVKFGRVRFGEPLTMAQKRSKVRQGFWKLWSRFAPPFSGSGCRPAGSFSGTVFGVALNEFYMGEGEIRATRAPLFFLSRDPEIRATDPPEIAAPFLFLARARKQRGQGHGHMAMGGLHA